MSDQAKPARQSNFAATDGDAGRRATPAVARFRADGLRSGDRVQSRRPVKNGGTYLHKAIGDILVQPGDVGYVREIWGFLGRIYYTVEFAERGVVVSMRGRELAAVDPSP